MTGHDDFDRTLAGWFESDALSPVPAGGLDRVLDATRRRRPRPAWLSGPGSHWVEDAHPAGSSSGVRSLPRLGMRWSTALILLLTAALVGGAILVGARLFQPAPLPAGRLGHLAYSLDGDIYVADWDGTNPVRIADGLPAVANSCPSFGGEGTIWSPDGLHLAYRSCGTVFISDPAGHVVASFPGTGWRVSWSPDSTRVATWVELSKTIGIYGLDGVRQALLSLPAGYGPGGDYDPVWSPEGMSLLIRLAPPRPSVVWELPIDSGTAQPVPDGDTRSQFDAVYSRDGARVAFVPFLVSQSLVIAEADGTELRVLVGANNDPIRGRVDGDYYENPAWSPTGDRVAFIWSHGRFYDQANNLAPNTYELRVVDVASGRVRSLASTRGIYPLQVIKFSPEGDLILFSRTDGDASSLWSVRADGSDAQLVVDGTTWGDWQSLPAAP